MGQLRELQQMAYESAAENGWYDEPREDAVKNLPKYLTYMSSELAEAFADWLAGHDPAESWTDNDGKPQGIPSELADMVIWALSLAGRYGFDLEEAVVKKIQFNVTREKHHGAERI